MSDAQPKVPRWPSVYPDGQRIKYYRALRGVTQEQLAIDIDRSKRWIEQVEKGTRCSMKVLGFIAQALEVDDIEELLAPPPDLDADIQQEWNFADKKRVGRSQPITTSNGLKYEVFRVPSLTIPGRYARAKCYDLTSLSSDDRERIRARLIRHPVVCHRVRNIPQIASHIINSPSGRGDYWWVLDEWIEGQTFAQVLKAARITDRLSAIMKDIAVGLQAMHQADVVRRELSPKSILIRADDGSAVLTDFELGKLLDGAPTVVPEKRWPRDAYRAPEVSDNPQEVRQCADLFSWGMILVHALAGQLPRTLPERTNVLDSADIPPSVRRIAHQCIQLRWRERPRSADKLVSALKRWK